MHQTPLHLALFYGRLDIARVLLDGGATIANSDFDWPSLHVVLRGIYDFEQDRISVVRLLLEHGADVHAQDKVHTTPLQLASCNGMAEIARVLLDAGAAANSKGLNGRSPLHAAVGGGHSPLIDHYVLIAKLLLERGADVDVPDDDGRTSLHLASYFGKVEMALALLNAGAYTNAKDREGQTPLHVVVTSQYPDESEGDRVSIVQLLLDHGADTNAKDNNHATPLYLASFHERTEVTALLLQYGEKANAKIGNQRTAPQLDLASVQLLDENIDEDWTSSSGSLVRELLPIWLPR